MKVRQRDRAQLLGQVPLFSYCSQRDLAKVAKLANELELPAGHTLIHEDAEVAYSFFVLVDGEAEVRRRNRRVATLGPGDCFGELALILRRPRTATVTLTAPSRLLSISAHNFRPLLMTSTVAAIFLLMGKTWARIITLAIVVIVALFNFLSIPEHPEWSIVVIGINLGIIWALALHGEELTG